MMPQIHLAHSAKFRVFKGLREQYVEALVGQILIGRPWNLAVYGQVHQHGFSWTMDPSVLKGFQCSGCGYVLVLWFGAYVGCGG